MNRSRILSFGAVLTGVVLWAWMMGWFDGKNYSDDPEVAELEKLRDENLPRMESMTSDERQAQGAQFRRRMQGLTEEQRRTFFESSMPVFVPMMAREFERRYDEFMAKSPEEQRKELDKRIDEMEARGGPGPRGGGARPNADPAKLNEFRKKMLDWTTPEQRAKFENGIQMINNRRRERGLNPLTGNGFF
jgi:hypothetical protein